MCEGMIEPWPWRLPICLPTLLSAVVTSLSASSQSVQVEVGLAGMGGWVQGRLEGLAWGEGWRRSIGLDTKLARHTVSERAAAAKA